jgi:hypothetical protein
VRQATDDDAIEPGWRPIDLERDSFEPEGKQDAPWPEDSTGGGRRSGAATADPAVSSGRRRARGCGRGARAGSR